MAREEEKSCEEIVVCLCWLAKSELDKVDTKDGFGAVWEVGEVCLGEM